MEIKIIQPGMLTTVQDLGRPGLRAAGVSLGGAADPWALRLANLLVGNAENTPALEMTLTGAELEFSHEALIAVTGGDFGGIESWRPHVVAAGARLKLGPARTGCRGYLAVHGGVVVPEVLGGRGTDLRLGLGGFAGRALRAGDGLRVPAGSLPRISGQWRIDRRLRPAYSPPAVLRVMRGAQLEEFGAEWRDAEYTVSAKSDRMGVRLSGLALRRSTAADLLSMAVAPGTVQVPPDGQPIVLLADAQTIGGYPQLAHVITVDVPLLAQLRPGDAVRFVEVTQAEARRLNLAREQALGMLREGLAQKFR